MWRPNNNGPSCKTNSKVETATNTSGSKHQKVYAKHLVLGDVSRHHLFRFIHIFRLHHGGVADLPNWDDRGERARGIDSHCDRQPHINRQTNGLQKLSGEEFKVSRNVGMHRGDM